VDDARRSEVGIAGLNRNPAKKIFNLLLVDSVPEFGFSHRLPKPKRNLSSRFGIENMPHLRLPARSFMLRGKCIVRMHLHRQLLGGEQELHQH
jgi:hypothetical protein